MLPAEYKCESLNIKMANPEYKCQSLIKISIVEHKCESLNLNVNRNPLEQQSRIG